MANKRSTRPTATVNVAARRDAAAVIGNDNNPEDPAITALRIRAQRIMARSGAHGVRHTLGDVALALVVK